MPSICPPTGEFIRSTPGNRSLARGLAILTAFRLGTGPLGNAELADRTGLPRPTVTRLTRTLVDAGFLAFDPLRSTYRLGPVCLSVGRATKRDSETLRRLHPLMKEVAENQRMNVGLAVPDGLEMVYLESIRRDHSRHFDHVETGSRVPMELTALGRAHLATLDAAKRAELLARVARRHGSRWAGIAAEIEIAAADIASKGYCSASWQRGIVSVAAPISEGHVANVSRTTSRAAREETSARCGRLLMRLIERIRDQYGAPDRAVGPPNG